MIAKHTIYIMKNLKKLRKDQIKCEICDKEFKTKNGLKNHFNITHDLEKEHHCNICQKAFNILNQLTTHMKVVHSKNKKYHKCVSCERLFSRAGNLKIHINTVHNGVKEQNTNVIHVERHFLKQVI